MKPEFEAASMIKKFSQDQFEITRDRFVRLFNEGPVGYLSVGQNGIIAQANQTFADMVTLRDQTPDDLIVNIDPPLIGTVLRNLLSNALKFSNRGGHVLVSANKDGDMVTLTVQDDGVGMNEETLALLFCLDNKITRPGTEGETSTGLGLILCKEFVEKHGGRIWADSIAGQGTAFSFTLPLSGENCDG